MLYFHRNFSA